MGKNILYGLQHVFVSNVWLDPIFVAAMVGLPVALASNMVNAIFIAAGLVTLTQATRLVKLPIIQGPSASFDALMISTGKAGGFAAAGGSILLSAMLVFILSITGIIGKLKVLFTPVVSGTVIFVVGVALAGFTLSEFLGGTPDMPSFASPETLGMAIPTALTVILCSIFGRKTWKSFSFLIALIIGDAIALGLGQISFAAVGEKNWFGLPQLFPFGMLEFHFATFITFFVAYLAAIIEAMGVYNAASDMTGVRLDEKRLRYGFAGESVGSMISSVLGGFPTTAYGQNVGLLRLTGVASRYPVIIAGLLFLVLGFVPKAGALLAVTPSPVVGGIFLPAAASLIFTGISILARMEKTEINYMITGISILLAIGLPSYAAAFTGVFGTFASSSVLIGALTSILLHLVFINIPQLLRQTNRDKRQVKGDSF
ncbi:uracil permease [Paenibacillus selenitireducens]|uniref:Uracil permease n=2 Tax=Paenibacillus selenitireducens TaxID=1324314 RepID=A0A1T2XNT6_9BACL|nr:uracil permease [Paenibacillus selenitireducens]